MMWLVFFGGVVVGASVLLVFAMLAAAGQADRLEEEDRLNAE